MAGDCALKISSKSGQRSRFVVEGPSRAWYMGEDAKGDEDGVHASASVTANVGGGDDGASVCLITLRVGVILATPYSFSSSQCKKRFGPLELSCLKENGEDGQSDSRSVGDNMDVVTDFEGEEIMGDRISTDATLCWWFRTVVGVLGRYSTASSTMLNFSLIDRSSGSGIPCHSLNS